MKTRLTAITVVAIALVACGATLPPITIAWPERPPVVEDPPPVKWPTPGVPGPVEAPPPPPVVEDEPGPMVNLNIVVHDAVTGAGVPLATCTIGDDRRTADGSGFINFAVRGSVLVRCAAGAYQAREPLDLPPGDHRVPLVPVAPPPVPDPPPAPPVVVPPSSGLGFPGCGKAGNTMAISGACLTAVAAASKSYPRCQQGDGVACHQFVREVARALRTTQSDNGWGLITKPRGQQACALEGDFKGSGVIGCGRSIEGGYGEDMVAYLPAGNPVNLWTGLDIIVGAGAPGAHHAGGPLPPAVGGRPDNLWAPVP
ncbi:MAG: hypothetical protein Q8T13_23590 [Acidobacteriota bacterium]|nr:hypothetical protein [Acidobacteriota bacterium]